MAEPPAPLPEDRIASLEAEKVRLEGELARLRESERRYRYSAELAGRLVWAADPDGNMLFLDTPFLALTGISVEQGLGTGWLDVLHPDDRAPTRTRWAKSLATGEVYAAEFRVLRADGVWRRTRSRAVAARDGGGEDPLLVRHDRGYRRGSAQRGRAAGRPRRRCARASGCIGTRWR